MNPRIAGNPEPIEQGLQSVWRRLSGATYERRWWGAQAAILAFESSVRSGLATGIVPDDVSMSCSPGSAIAVLTATFPGPVSPGRTPPGANENAETMEIDFKDETFPVHQNPTFIDLDTSLINDLEEKIKNHEENPYANEATAEFQYYALRSRGIESYRTKLPIVTWTRTVGGNYNTQIDLANVGAIFSTAGLAASIGAPVLFQIPTGNVGVVADTDTGFAAGWMKGARLGYASDGKIQMILTGEYGLWATPLYEIVSSDP